MIVDSPTAFSEAAALFPPRHPAAARAAFLVAPDGFRLAEQSAQDNRYMAIGEAVDVDRARGQHGELLRRLRASLPVFSFSGDPDCPDGLFPNNVFATVEGRLIVGAMRHRIRQREAGRADIRSFFQQLLGYEVIDLSGRSLVAELTGSLVIDRSRNIGYCGLSERCDRTGAEAMHEAFGLDLTYCFELAAGEYHTNVVLAVLAGRAAVIAANGFANRADADAIADVYRDRVVAIDDRQKRCFAANVISLDDRHVWMSTTAASALPAHQHAALATWGFAVEAVELDEVERAGGSLRCCVAEIF